MPNTSDLKTLLSKKSVGNVFHGPAAVKARNHVEVFKNPDMCDGNNPIKSGFFDSVRIGVVGFDIYVWADDVGHNTVARAVKEEDFPVKLEYTNETQHAFVNIETKKKFSELVDSELLIRIKKLFPKISKIEQFSSKKAIYSWD